MRPICVLLARAVVQRALLACAAAACLPSCGGDAPQVEGLQLPSQAELLGARRVEFLDRKAACDRRLDAIRAELHDLRGEHAWAGFYSAPFGYESLQLWIAPRSGFALRWNVGDAGESGTVEERDGELWLSSECPVEPTSAPRRLRIERVAGRRQLSPVDQEKRTEGPFRELDARW